MTIETVGAFLGGGGTALSAVLWFVTMQKKEKRDKLLSLNDSIYKEIDRLQVKLDSLEKQRDYYREMFYQFREAEVIKDEGRNDSDGSQNDLNGR